MSDERVGDILKILFTVFISAGALAMITAIMFATMKGYILPFLAASGNHWAQHVLTGLSHQQALCSK